MPHVRRSMLIMGRRPTPNAVRDALVGESALVAVRRRRTRRARSSGCPTPSARLDRRRSSTRRPGTTHGAARDARATCACRSSPGSCGSRRGSAPRARSPTPRPVSTAAATASEPPPPLKPLPVVPPVPFTPEQAGRLGRARRRGPGRQLLGRAALPERRRGHRAPSTSPTRRSGVALAIARAGVLVSLVAIALADRLGRRGA